ncbi:MAG TPA: GNAT family N-acetyltransferase [Actinocrinis sp.]|nr:GNAT family N-acetyltransferase [Actinocrinis sp.]
MTHWPATVTVGENAASEWTTLTTDADDALTPDSATGRAWDALWHTSHEATAFQHRAWLAAWWAGYGRPGGLRLILVWHHGRPVAGAALYLAARDPLRRLRLVGSGVSDYGDVLLAGTDRAGATRRLAAALAGLRRPVDLRETAPGSAAGELAALFPRRTGAHPDSTCMDLAARNWHDTVAALPRRSANRLNAKSRRLDRLGVRAEPTRPQEAAAAVELLLRLHAEQWRGRGINPEHLTGRYCSLLRSAVPQLIADGCGELVRFSVDGETVACDLLLYWEDTVAAYLNGASPERRTQIDYSTLFVREGLSIAEKRDAKHYSFLRGCEPYKLRWHPTPHVNLRLVLGGAPSTELATAALGASASARDTAVASVRALRRRRDHR